ncbi:hypothetical protein LPB41_21950 [Thalassospira sp. MA62]|nr:hypothetical protein [Thalassospira sp. MA62]
MSPVLAIYGKEHILGYVRGTLESTEEKQEIESLVQSDPRAASIVEQMKANQLSDGKTVDFSACYRLRRLQGIAKESGLLS